MRISLKTVLMASCLSLAVAACSPAETKTTASSKTASAQALPKMTDAKSYGKAAAEWQLATINDLSYLPNRIPQSSYNRGTIYAGAIERGADLALLRPTLEKMDKIIDERSTVSLKFVEPKPGEKGAEGTCQTRWCWADAIFMAPPAWAAVSNVTGDDKYRQYAVEETDATIEYLYDPNTHMFFRDSRYFTLKTKNGKGVFWSRGNGWVYAGLARLMETLPEGHEARARYEALFVEFTDALVSRSPSKTVRNYTGWVDFCSWPLK